MLLLLLDTDVQVPKRSPRAWSIILYRHGPAMAGGKQLFEGVIIPAFCVSQANVAITRFLWVKILNTLYFCRELSFVAIARCFGGAFGQNLVMGGTKTF